eukprot:PLAT9754.1.p2 GENE.PLAT9754.1~~PLAT9754.1.p2  ORF type:complete len:214 (-),score=111.06 PLAT9754.1:367-972(-)
MFEKLVIIDCRAHLLGRLASIIAKELLSGQRIVAVRCEQIDVSGSLMRNRMKYMRFLRKRTATNPRHGPFHQRSPSKILWRTVRGMLPHKTARGKSALLRLQVFEGIPAPFDKQKRVVIPQALRCVRLRPGRRFCQLSDLSDSVGWRHKDLLIRLEDARKAEAEAYYLEKKAAKAARAKASEAVEAELDAADKELLASVGY